MGRVDLIITDIASAALRCEQAAQTFESEPLKSEIMQLHKALDLVDESWSKSWIGYHASLYLEDFRPPQRGERFDAEWGMNPGILNQTNGPWQEYSYAEVKNAIQSRAGISDLSGIELAARNAEDAFRKSRGELLPTLDALLSIDNNPTLRELRTEIEKLPSSYPSAVWIRSRVPKQASTRDSFAMTQWLQSSYPPPHLSFKAWLFEVQSTGLQAKKLSESARHVELYLRQRIKMMGQLAPQNSFGTDSEHFAKVTQTQRRQLHTVLLAAFPTRAALNQLVSLELNQNPAVVAEGNDLSETILNLIQWAEARGQIAELLAGAQRQNPDNPDLQAFLTQFRDETAHQCG